jgi:hypothetical protein
MSEVSLICSNLTCLADIPSSSSKALDDTAVLNLHCNRLSNLNGLRSIVSITSLNISSNEFSSINLPELCLLPSLTSLDIAGNNIHSLRDMPFLPSLRTLSIAYNRLQSLDGFVLKLRLLLLCNCMLSNSVITLFLLGSRAVRPSVFWMPGRTGSQKSQALSHWHL